MNSQNSSLAHATLEMFSEAILWVNSKAMVLGGNAAATKLFGIPMEKLSGRSVFELRGDLEVESWEMAWQKIKEARSYSETAHFSRSDKTKILQTFHGNFITLEDGTEILCWLFAPGLSESGDRSAAPQAGNVYQGIFELIGDPIFIKDRQHRLIMMNDAFYRMLNTTREKIQGLSDYDLFPKAEADIFWAKDEKVFLTGIEDVNEESFTPPGQETMTVVTRKQRYIDAEGNAFIVGIFKNISDLKNAEAKLQKANERLEEKVKDRTIELERANLAMQVHIEQLNYLNEKGRNFASLLQRDQVIAEIFNTFKGRFPGCPIQLVEPEGAGLKSTNHSSQILFHLRQALECLDPSRLESEKEVAYFKSTPEKQTVFPLFPHRIWIPFFSGNGFLGGIQAFLPDSMEERLKQDISLLGTLASQASIALNNANNYLALGERTRIESELQVARKIQMHYVPETPTIPGMILHGQCLPALEMGGDYLDYFQNETGDWIIVVADVCGKGIPAALVMTSLRSCIRSEGRRKCSSKELLVAVNRLMTAELQREKIFITCLCMVIFQGGSTLNFSRAGHPHLLAFGPPAQAPRILASKGLALGMANSEHFSAQLEEVTFSLRPGDRLFAYTDGVDEAMDPENRAYGRDRLFQVLARVRPGGTPFQWIQDVLADVQEHTKGERQHDDMTLVAIEKIS